MTFQTPKILVAGDFRFPFYQAGLCNGLRTCGAQVEEVILPAHSTAKQLSFFKNSQKLYSEIVRIKPDLLFLYRVDAFFASILKRVKNEMPELKIFVYHNDDPFRNQLKRCIKHYHYKRSIKYSDITYVYRKVNINEAKALGAKRVEMYMSHYIQSDLVDYKKYDCIKDNKRTVFIGHFEPDGRDKIIDCLFKNSIDIHIYGQDWANAFQQYGWPLSHLHPQVHGKGYREAIHSSAFALAFFSQRNRDDYTRRCFEIPIYGTILVAPRTITTEQIFENGKNAILFSSNEDLLKQLMIYMATSTEELTNIAYNGYLLIKNGNFSEIDRARKILCDYKSLCK